jgi:hypothetical protein
MVYIKEISWHSPGVTDENNERCQPEHPVFQSRFEPRTKARFTRYGFYTVSVISPNRCKPNAMFTQFGCFAVRPLLGDLYCTLQPPISALPVEPAPKMDVNTFLIMYWYRRRRRINMRYWLHPIVMERSCMGSYRTLMYQLRRDELKFFNYFRMSMSTFDDLLRRVEGNLTRRNTTMRRSISPEEI